MSLPGKMVLASGNPGKLREIARMLDDLGVEIVAQSALGVEEAEETGETFAENALIKARHAAATTGLPAIADDSGLAVDALDGRPGVRSARYSGPDADAARNIDKLLAELAGVPPAARNAAFVCVACFVTPDGAEPVYGEGRWAGQILEERRGAGGFGYDPVFLDPDSGKSAAELTPGEKDRVSHRGKALRALKQALATRYSRE